MCPQWGHMLLTHCQRPGKGLPNNNYSQGCNGVYFGRGMAGLSFSKQLYLLEDGMIGVGPFLSPLSRLLTWHAHPCVSCSHHSWSSHLAHTNTCSLGFSSLPTSAIWVRISRGREQFITGCSRSAWHGGDLVSNLPPGDTNERSQHGA